MKRSTSSGTSVEETYTDDTTGTDTPSGTHTTPSPYATPVSKGYKRFHGSVNLDPITMGLDAAKIAEEVIQHFTLESGTEVNIRLEIEAFTPKGISDKTVRIIRENSRSLNFQVNEFETE